MSKDIKEEALKLVEKYKSEYKEWSKENPGKVMNGLLMKEDTARKASFAESIEDLEAMKRCYEISYNAMIDSKSPYGFIFMIRAMEELINIIKN